MQSELTGFFSYAREDDNREYEEIQKIIQQKIGAEIGRNYRFDLFRDERDIRNAQDWSRAVATSLSTSCIFVWIQTKTWLQSPVCAMERNAFEERIAELSRRTGVPDARLEELMFYAVRYRDLKIEDFHGHSAVPMLRRLQYDKDLLERTSQEEYVRRLRFIGQTIGKKIETLVDLVGLESLVQLPDEHERYVERWSATFLPGLAPEADIRDDPELRWSDERQCEFVARPSGPLAAGIATVLRRSDLLGETGRGLAYKVPLAHEDPRAFGKKAALYGGTLPRVGHEKHLLETVTQGLTFPREM